MNQDEHIAQTCVWDPDYFIRMPMRFPIMNYLVQCDAMVFCADIIMSCTEKVLVYLVQKNY